MRRIARTLELSLAVHGPAANEAMRAKRREEIARMDGQVSARIALALDAFTAQHRSAATKSLSGLTKVICGMRYVRNGALSSEYSDAAQVLKVYRDTVGMTDGMRQVFATERQAMCDNLSEHLGTTVVAQTFSIDPHPLGGYMAVIGHQPFVPGRDLDLFRTNTLDLNERGIADYCGRQPDGKPQLMGLAEGTFLCDDDAGLVPDLNGVDNFRLVGTAETLRLIDAEPIDGTDNQGGHDLILQQAELLAEFLDRI